LRHIDELNGTNIVEVGIDLSEFYTSVEWDILEVPAVRWGWILLMLFILCSLGIRGIFNLMLLEAIEIFCKTISRFHAKKCFYANFKSHWVLWSWWIEKLEIFEGQKEDLVAK
jgi:hypothetical protein